MFVGDVAHTIECCDVEQLSRHLECLHEHIERVSQLAYKPLNLSFREVDDCR